MTFPLQKRTKTICTLVKDLSSFIAMTCAVNNDTPVQPQLERSERRRTQWVRLHKNYAEVELLWAMTKAVELLKKFYGKGKTMEELLTDVMLEKAKQTIA